MDLYSEHEIIMNVFADAEEKHTKKKMNRKEKKRNYLNNPDVNESNVYRSPVWNNE